MTNIYQATQSILEDPPVATMEENSLFLIFLFCWMMMLMETYLYQWIYICVCMCLLCFDVFVRKCVQIGNFFCFQHIPFDPKNKIVNGYLLLNHCCLLNHSIAVFNSCMNLLSLLSISFFLLFLLSNIK